MVSPILEALGRLWAIMLAFVGGSKSASPSLLPLRQDVGMDSFRTEAWHNQKEQFLRHPSLGSKERYSAETTAALSKREKGSKGSRTQDRPSPVVVPVFTVEDWNLPPLDENSKPPPRPPRPPSCNTLPAVIVTPCTPSFDGFLASGMREIVLPCPSASPLELFKPGQLLSPDDVFGRKGTRMTDPPQPTSTCPELHVQERGDRSETTLDSDVVNAFELARRSFILPDSLKGISFQPPAFDSDPLSACNTSWDSSWLNPRTSVAQLRPRAPSYVTSTPTKRRRADDGTGEQGFQSVSSSTTQEVSQSEIAILPPSPSPAPVRPRAHSHSRSDPDLMVVAGQSQQLSDEQLNLLPYPDVFDLDMYLGPQSARSSVASFRRTSRLVEAPTKNPPRVTRTRSRHRSSSMPASVASSSGPKNPPRKTLRHSTSTPTLGPGPSGPQPRPLGKRDQKRTHRRSQSQNAVPSSLRSPRRFGFMPNVPTRGSGERNEIKRYRDHYRHAAYSSPTRSGASENRRSASKNKGDLRGKGKENASDLTPVVLPLQLSTRRLNTNMGSRPAMSGPTIASTNMSKVASTGIMTSRLPVRAKARNAPPPPRVIRDHKSNGSTSTPARTPLTQSNPRPSHDPTPLPPIVVVSPSESISWDVEYAIEFDTLDRPPSTPQDIDPGKLCRDSSDSDSVSLAALKTRLREACDNFSKSSMTSDESGSLNLERASSGLQGLTTGSGLSTRAGGQAGVRIS